MRDDLKRKGKNLTLREGVSLNNLINATVAACVAQEEALADGLFFLFFLPDSCLLIPSSCVSSAA